MRKILTILTMACCVSASHAADLSQTQDGLLNNAATWGGNLPGPRDNLVNSGWNLTVSSPYTTTGLFSTAPGSDTEVTAGGSLAAGRFGGQEYGAVTYSRVKVPVDVNDLNVRASSSLLTPSTTGRR